MQDCPSHEDLRQFLSGVVPQPRVDGLRAHVGGCGRCQTVLDQLTDSDVLSDWKRQARMVEADLEEQTALLRLRQSLRTAPSDSTRDMDDSGSDEPTVSWRDILGPPERPGDLGTLGSYHIEAELGRGGMGIVFRAYDAALHRLVAVKVLRPEQAHERARRRLVREARTAAQFRHDHLVTMYAVVDPPDGLPYLVMEYLAGPTLSALIRSGPGLQPRRAADIAAQVADGLAAAHAAGLVHRDIKPDNIMIDPATGRAKLMDFGLARDEANHESLTREDVLAGTPTHMSPEQVRGVGPLDGRSDVYSLGVTLYEALTGEVPFRGAPHMVLQQVCDDDPRPPRRLNDQVPRDLETICLKAMAKEPSRRYATAGDLADDLRRWLNGEPIRARPLGPLGRLGRWCRRNTKIAALIAAVFSLLVILTVVSFVAVVRISREQVRTLREQKAARDHYKLALETLNSLVFDVNTKLGSKPGTLKLKQDILETARTGLERIAQSSEADGNLDRGAVVAYNQLGYLLFTLGRTPEAQKAYERSRDLAATMIKADRGAIQPQLDLASAYDNIGDLLRFNNDIPGAEANFLKAIGVREQLIQGHRQDPEILRNLCVSMAKIGLIHLRRGEYPEALVQFKRSLTILDEFAPIYPSRIKVRGDYEYINRQLSEACMMSDWDAAVSYAQKSLESAQAVVALEPDNVVSRTKLAIVHERLGVASGLRGNVTSAEANFQKALEVRQALSAAEPEAAELQRNVAVSHRSCGDLLLHRHDVDAVRAHYEKGLAICETLAAADPGSVQKQGDILETYGVLADNAERAERFTEALNWAERASRRLDQVEREKHMSKAFVEANRVPVNIRCTVYKAAANSLKLEDASAMPSPEMAPALCEYWLLLRGFALARRRRHAEAAALAKDLRQRNSKNAIIQLRCSRIYALCATAVASGKPEPELRKLEQSYIDSTLDALSQVLRLAPEMALDAFAETDFDFLRQRGILQSFVQDLNRHAKPRGSSK